MGVMGDYSCLSVFTSIILLVKVTGCPKYDSKMVFILSVSSEWKGLRFFLGGS